MKPAKHDCPVCGNPSFMEFGSYEDCPVCGWTDDPVQEDEPDLANCGNRVSLNEARELYKKGERYF